MTDFEIVKINSANSSENEYCAVHFCTYAILYIACEVLTVYIIMQNFLQDDNSLLGSRLLCVT